MGVPFPDPASFEAAGFVVAALLEFPEHPKNAGSTATSVIDGNRIRRTYHTHQGSLFRRGVEG